MATGDCIDPDGLPLADPGDDGEVEIDEIAPPVTKAARTCNSNTARTWYDGAVKIIPSIALLALLTACASAAWPKPAGVFYHAATWQQAEARVDQHIAAGLEVSGVSHTGSMRPWLNGGELVALAPYRGGYLAPGTVVVFDRGDHPRVIHMVVHDNGRAIYITGINNRWSDGWVSRAAIKSVLVEVIKAPR